MIVLDYNNLMFYGGALIVSLIVGFLLKLPLKVNKESFESNVFFPTIFIVLGLCAITKFLFGYNIVYGIIIGIISAIFSKYAINLFSGVDYGVNSHNN